MNKSIFRNIIFLAIFAIVISGCKHETDTFDGPSLIDRFGEFSVISELEVSQPTVDFAAGETVFFKAEFNKNIDWIIEITGMTSGSVKRIEGFNRMINMSNATWDGGTTDLPLFTNEICSVVLTVPEEPSFISTGQVETLSNKTYDGTLFTDFETNLGTNVFTGNFEFELTPETGRRSDIPAEGGSYFLMEGTDDVVPNFFVGLVDISSAVSGETYVPVPTSVPEELYFNFFMYSEGTPHGLGIIDFAFDTNDSGAFEEGEDLMLRVPEDYSLGTWEGWRLISHPMSDIGVTQADLEKLVSIRLLLISQMNSQPDPPIKVGFGIDFMIFTQGGPLEL